MLLAHAHIDADRRAGVQHRRRAGEHASACSSCSTCIERLHRRAAAGSGSSRGAPADQRYYVSDTRASARATGWRPRTRRARRRRAARRLAARPSAGAPRELVGGPRRRHEVRAGQPARGRSRAASTSAAASRTCRSSSGTRGRCSSATGTRRCSSTRSCDDLALDESVARARSRAFAPDATVVTTAPSYLFWRCAPPELRVPQETLRALCASVPGGRIVRRSARARRRRRATLRKLGADVAVLGRVRGACCRSSRRRATTGAGIASIAWRDATASCSVQGATARSRHGGAAGAALGRRGRSRGIAHHHHRFDAAPAGPGRRDGGVARLPVSLHVLREGQLPRRLPQAAAATVILDELDALIAQGVEYVYFIDEIFLPEPRAARGAGRSGRCAFGVQTRIDLWTRADARPARARRLRLDRGRRREHHRARAATCSTRTAGCRPSELTERLIHAKRRVPFVQANLLESGADDPAKSRRGGSICSSTACGRTSRCRCSPIPGRPTTPARWGAPDDRAWERAHATLPRAVRSRSATSRKRGRVRSRRWSSSMSMPRREVSRRHRRTQAGASRPDDGRRRRRRLAIRARPRPALAQRRRGRARGHGAAARPGPARRGARAGVALLRAPCKLEWMDDPWDDVARSGQWLLLARATRSGLTSST